MVRNWPQCASCFFFGLFLLLLFCFVLCVCVFERERERSHRLVLTPSIGIPGYNNTKNDGPTTSFEHNPQQFRDWKPDEKFGVIEAWEKERDLVHNLHVAPNLDLTKSSCNVLSTNLPHLLRVLCELYEAGSIHTCLLSQSSQLIRT